MSSEDIKSVSLWNHHFWASLRLSYANFHRCQGIKISPTQLSTIMRHFHLEINFNILFFKEFPIISSFYYVHFFSSFTDKQGWLIIS